MRTRQSGNRAIGQKLAVLGLVVVLALLAMQAPRVWADEGWTIKSFDVAYTIMDDGSVDVVEDIQVDFGSLQKHGIFRDLIVEQKYDGPCGTCKPGDEYNREYKVSIAGVDDGQHAWPYETSRQGADLQIKIGDPDKTISGPQRYRIRYRLSGALNAQTDLDEFFWNVTGNQWPVPI